jgi:hypothetical protein
MVRDKNGKKPYSDSKKKFPNDLNVFSVLNQRGRLSRTTEHNKYKLNCVEFYLSFSTIKEYIRIGSQKIPVTINATKLLREKRNVRLRNIKLINPISDNPIAI